MNNLAKNTPDVAKAYARIKPYIHKTPLLHSNLLNEMLGSKIYFKMDAVQKTGAFKIRGVLNHLLVLKEKGEMPKKIVAYSTGNHALAMSYAAKLFGIEARVYLPENVSPIKKRIAKYYGADVVEVATRQEAEDAAAADGQNGFYYLHPSDDDETIAGAGTMCYEALLELDQMGEKTDAIFGPCGGGGLLSGSYLAKELLRPAAQLHGVEPKIANDAHQSLNSSEIFRFTHSPETIADGLRALSVSSRTLKYLKNLDEFHLVEEESIRYWTAWLIQMMKITCEPSAAISMAAAHSWLQHQPQNRPLRKLATARQVQGVYGAQNRSVLNVREDSSTGATPQLPAEVEFGKRSNKVILILITGGNVDPEFYQELSTLDLFLSA